MAKNARADISKYDPKEEDLMAHRSIWSCLDKATKDKILLLYPELKYLNQRNK